MQSGVRRSIITSDETRDSWKFVEEGHLRSNHKTSRIHRPLSFESSTHLKTKSSDPLEHLYQIKLDEKGAKTCLETVLFCAVVLTIRARVCTPDRSIVLPSTTLPRIDSEFQYQKAYDEVEIRGRMNVER